MFTRSSRVAAIALGIATAAVIPLAGPATAATDSVTVTSSQPTKPGEVQINWDASIGYEVDYFRLSDDAKSLAKIVGGNDGQATTATSGSVTFLAYSTTYDITVTAVGTDKNNQTSSDPWRLQGYRLLSKPSVYTLNKGKSVTITGSLNKEGTNIAVSNAQIKLQARPAGAPDWTTVDTANTNGQGEFTTSNTPKRNTDYRTWYSGDGAGGWRTPIPVTVKVPITRQVSPNPVNVNSTATFSGKVRAPARLVKGQTIRLQRRTTNGWNTVGTDTVSATAGYSINYTPPSQSDGSFRLLLPSSRNFAASTSKTIALKVN